MIIQKSRFLYMSIFIVALLFLITGCRGEGGWKQVDPLDLDEPTVNEEDSVIDELTPIIIIGDDVSVPVYKCSTETDCNRCQDGDVYSQDCVNGTCQGSLDLAQDCKDSCSAGQCVDKDEFTADDTEFSVGEDLDLDEILNNDDAIVDNDDLLPDPDDTKCSNSIEQCIGYRGAGSAYLTNYPACECKLIYVPAYCSPMDPPCSDFSSRSDYPECACKK